MRTNEHHKSKNVFCLFVFVFFFCFFFFFFLGGGGGGCQLGSKFKDQHLWARHLDCFCAFSKGAIKKSGCEKKKRKEKKKTTTTTTTKEEEEEEEEKEEEEEEEKEDEEDIHLARLLLSVP